MKKIVFLAGLVIGFVVGSSMGRGPYESLERTARQVADDPEVQRRAAQARESAGRVAHDAAETVKEKAPEVADTVQSAVTGATRSVKEKAPEVAGDVQAKVSDAASTVKERLGGDDAEQDAGPGPAPSSEELSERSAGTASAAGDAEVGEDRPLGS